MKTLPKAKKGKGVINKGLGKLFRNIPEAAIAPECRHEWEPYSTVETRFREWGNANGVLVLSLYCKFCLEVRNMP